jgi:hypothetical protein
MLCWRGAAGCTLQRWLPNSSFLCGNASCRWPRTWSRDHREIPPSVRHHTDSTEGYGDFTEGLRKLLLWTRGTSCIRDSSAGKNFSLSYGGRLCFRKTLRKCVATVLPAVFRVFVTHGAVPFVDTCIINTTILRVEMRKKLWRYFEHSVFLA